jgi:uncharacterized protein YgbK (DUF1537 family)
VTAGPRVLVVADDLSGAADCAITWVPWGLDVVVALDAAAAGVDAADVLAVDTDSRRAAPAAAAAATGEAVRRHAGPACRVLYKKIDSTLRGNIGVEVAAAAGADRFALFAPAFPAAGRTMEGGGVLVAGTPLAATALWRLEGGGRDPDPVAMLAAAGLSTAAAPLALVRGGGLAAWLHDRAAEGFRAVACDAATEADLAAIAEAGAALDRPLLWVGSGGLARHLRAVTGAAAAAGPPAARRPPGRPVLVAVGSVSAVSRRQLAAVAAQPGAGHLEIAPDVLLAPEESPTRQSIARRLDVLLAEPAMSTVAVSIRAGAGDDPAIRGAALAAALGRMLAPRLACAGGIVVTGGETARALLAAAGVAGLRLAGEVEPGVPLGIALGSGPACGLPVVTKAGAFGGDATLAGCVAALRALPS